MTIACNKVLRLDNDTRRLLEQAAKECRKILHIDPGATSGRVLSVVEARVRSYANKKQKIDDVYDERILDLGSVWGEMLVCEFQWVWSEFEFSDHSSALGILDPICNRAVYPFHYMYGCIVNKAEIQIELSYNLVKSGKIPSRKHKAVDNLMDHVHYIISP